MRYKKRTPCPEVCSKCPNLPIEICFQCGHFSKRYIITREELKSEQLKYEVIRKLLGISPEEDFFVVRWKPTTKRPINYSYVLMKELDEELGVITSYGCYENGCFWYLVSKDMVPVKEKDLLGWDYLPYDHHLNERQENQPEV